jgi:hypothetical protein
MPLDVHWVAPHGEMANLLTDLEAHLCHSRGALAKGNAIRQIKARMDAASLAHAKAPGL